MFYLFIFLIQIYLLYFLSRRLINQLYWLYSRLTHHNEKFSTLLLAITFLPGTYIHEIAHFVAALFLVVPVGKLELSPKRDGNQIKLGSVSIAHTDPLRHTIIGLAPLILGVAIILGLLIFVRDHAQLTNPLILTTTIYILFQIGNSMFASPQDLVGFYRLMMILGAALIAMWLLNISISIDPQSIFTPQITDLLQTATYLMCVPIAIDSVLIFFLRLLK